MSCFRGGFEAASYYPTPESLEAAYVAAQRRGITPRALLLSSRHSVVVSTAAQAIRRMAQHSEHARVTLIDAGCLAPLLHLLGRAGGDPAADGRGGADTRQPAADLRVERGPRPL